MIPSDASLQLILARAHPDEAEMKRTRERFGRAKTEAPMYANGGPLDMAIYNAPISVVGSWARFDCGSAGDIRQSLATDLATLAAKYANGGPVLAPAPSPVQQAGTIFREEVSQLPGRVLGGAIEEVANVAQRTATPIVADSAQRQFMAALPYIAIGAAVVFLLKRR